MPAARVFAVLIVIDVATACVEPTAVAGAARLKSIAQPVMTMVSSLGTAKVSHQNANLCSQSCADG